MEELICFSCYYEKRREVFYDMYGDVNMVALLVGVGVHMVLGMVWYNRRAFGKTWLKESKKREKDLKKNAQSLYAGSLGSAVVMAYILGYFLKMSAATTLQQAFSITVLAWIGMTAAPAAFDYSFAGRSRVLYFINVGYLFVSFILIAAIFTLLR